MEAESKSRSGEASGEDRENPYYVVWKRQDQLLLSWIMSSMSLEILSLVVSSQTSLELWKKLEKQFGSESMAKKVHLKMLFSNLRKRSVSMTEYFTKLRTISDGLALTGSPLNNTDLITHLITGLDHSYYPVVVYIEPNMLTMDLSEAYAMLLTHEARLENSKNVDSKEVKNNFMANVAQTGNFQKKGNGNNQNNWNKNGGGNWNQNTGGRGGYQGQGRGNWNGNWNQNFNVGRGFAGGFNTGGNFNNGGFAGNFNNGNANAGGFGRGGFGGNKKNFAQGSVMCQICFRFNHTAAECRDMFNRNFAPSFPVQGYHPNQGPNSSTQQPSTSSSVPAVSPTLNSISLPHINTPPSPLSSNAHSHTSNQNSSVALPQPSLPIVSAHPMVTRAKAGIFKPKTYLTATQDIKPTSVKAALADQKWYMAMTDELHALRNNETWTLVPAESATKIVGNKWVFRVKYNPDESVSKYKARLVAKGFHQTYGVDFFETFSPVVKPCTIRIILSLAVMNHWTIRQLDVNNAFLNGVLSEEVFMHQPEGFIDPQHPTYVCKLNKALYGLKQAPRAWYDRLRGSLLQWGFHTSRSDTSLFLKHTGSDILVILIYVDDILVTGSSSAQIEKIIALLGSEFALKDLGDFNYFLGLEVTPSSAGLHLSQTKYVGDILKKAHMLDSKGCNTLMSVADKLYKDKGKLFENPSLYRSVIGSLQYVTLTRPDIAFTVNKLSQFLAAPIVLHWQACKRVLRYLQCTATYGIQFYNSKSFSLTAFSDADWGSDPDDRRSVGGYCIFLGSNLVSWSSKKQNELRVQLTNTHVLYCDNKSAEALASNPKYHSRTKHIELDIHFVKEHIAKKEFAVEHVSSSNQLADVLTKPLSFDHFAYIRAKLNVCPRP
ncbi:retrovirus-related pol polyprotein from transposon RE1 [Citrus sinensis]|nr:retrovirus-related pol polyprotein from transposon RE1 [Citrus sinensis]